MTCTWFIISFSIGGYCLYGNMLLSFACNPIMHFFQTSFQKKMPSLHFFCALFSVFFMILGVNYWHLLQIEVFVQRKFYLNFYPFAVLKKITCSYLTQSVLLSYRWLGYTYQHHHSQLAYWIFRLVLLIDFKFLIFFFKSIYCFFLWNSIFGTEGKLNSSADFTIPKSK